MNAYRTPATGVSARQPSTPVRRIGPLTAVLHRLADRLDVGQCRITLPDGATVTACGTRDLHRRASVTIHDYRALRMLIWRGKNGFAEAYLDGLWSTPDLSGFLDLMLRNEDALGGFAGRRTSQIVDRLAHLLRGNTKAGSKRNIAYHYDLSNDFYAAWLDSGMTYSSAWFTSPTDTLDDAQRRKYHRLAKVLDVRPGHRVLEIGCGWGSFAILLATEYGCHVTAITLSKEQLDWTQQRVNELGLEHKIEVRLQDYRDVDGTFDRVASIEMFEAVGEAYWPTFMRKLSQFLGGEGRAALQIITIDDARFDRYRRGADFIQRHIFPGGMLPAPGVFADQCTRAGLSLTDQRYFGSSYAETLAIWNHSFQAAWPEIGRLGFSERFKRLWEFYLAYCEAGFRVGAIDVGHFVISPARD